MLTQNQTQSLARRAVVLPPMPHQPFNKCLLPQVQEALDDTPSDPDGADECELRSESQGWRERASNSSDWRRDSWDGEDGLSALLGAEHLYTGWHLQNGFEAAECGELRREKNTYCEESAEHTDKHDAAELHIKTHGTDTPGDLNTQQITNSVAEKRTITEGLKTHVTSPKHRDSIGADCTDICRKESTGSQTIHPSVSQRGETVNEGTGAQSTVTGSKDSAYASRSREERNGNCDTHNDGQSCIDVYHGVSPCLHLVCNLNDSKKHRSPGTEIREYTDSNINEWLDNKEDKHTDCSRTHAFESTEVEVEGNVQNTQTHCSQNSGCRKDAQSMETVDSGIDTHCVKTFSIKETGDTEHATRCRPDHSLPSETHSVDTQSIETQPSQVSPGLHCGNPVGTVQEQIGGEHSLQSNSCKDNFPESHSIDGNVHTGSSDKVYCSDVSETICRHSPGSPGHSGRVLSTPDTLLVYTTEASQDVTGSAEGSDRSEDTETGSIDLKGHDALQACVNDTCDEVCVPSVQPRAMPECSVTERAPSDQAVKALVLSGEAGFSPTSIPDLVNSEGTGEAQRVTHTGTHSVDSEERQQPSGHKIQLTSSSRNSRDAAEAFLLISQLSEERVHSWNGLGLSVAEGFVGPLTVQAREGGLLSEGWRNREEEKVCEDTLSSCDLSLQTGCPEKPSDHLAHLLLTHSDLKTINSLSPELLQSSSLTAEKNRSCSSHSAEEVEDRSQGPASARSEEKGCKHGQSVVEQLLPLHSAIHLKELPSDVECCTSTEKPVKTCDPLFIEHEHSRIQPIDPLEKQTLVIDLEHKTDIESPRSDVTVTLCPESSATEIITNPHQSNLPETNIPSPQCQDLGVSNSEPAKEAKEAAHVGISYSDQWLEPFSDRSESDSEDSDLTDCLRQDKPRHPISDQGSVNSEGARRSSDQLFCLEREPYWSSEDSAVSGLGEDLDNSLLPQVRTQKPPQKEYLDKSTCLHAEDSLENTDQDLNRVQKSHSDPKDTHHIQWVQANHLTHSERCKDNRHSHTHTSLCTDCVQETGLDPSFSPPSQPWSEVLEPLSGCLVTKGHLQSEQTVSYSVIQDNSRDSYCIGLFGVPVTETGNPDHSRQLSHSCCSDTHSVDTQSTETHNICLRSQSSQVVIVDLHPRSVETCKSPAKAAGYTHPVEGPGLPHSRSLEPIPETERCSDYCSTPEDENSLQENESKHAGSVEMKPSESDRDIFLVSSDMPSSSISEGCAGNTRDTKTHNAGKYWLIYCKLIIKLSMLY